VQGNEMAIELPASTFANSHAVIGVYVAGFISPVRAEFVAGTR